MKKYFPVLFSPKILITAFIVNCGVLVLLLSDLPILSHSSMAKLQGWLFFIYLPQMSFGGGLFDRFNIKFISKSLAIIFFFVAAFPVSVLYAGILHFIFDVCRWLRPTR